MPQSPMISPDPVADQPRARGAVDLSVRACDRGTILENLRQSGSLRALFPRVDSRGLQSVLINTAGGITGGDDFTCHARAGADTTLTLTTQAAERAYRALPGQTGRLRNRISAGSGARVNWLPQETILYDGCALARSLRVDLEEGSSFLMAEPLVFGRRAMGEVLRDACLTDRIEIRRAAKPVYLDAIALRGDVTAQLARRQTAAGAGAMASVVYLAGDAAARLAPVRALLGDMAGASLIGPDMLVLRLLARDSYLLRCTLIPILNHLTGGSLPRCWTT